MQRESGLVSILTVILFMIFVSILVVGFIKIMADEQRQATDNDLSASALTAAQSGVEDAKRVILYCLGGGLDLTDTARCNNLFGSGRATDPCDSFKNAAKGLFNSMGITYDLSSNEAIVGNPEFNQYYTCLSVTSDPSSVQKTVAADKSEFIKLDVNGPYDSVEINWSDSSGTWGDRPLALGSDFTALSSWNNGAVDPKPRPPVLRVQVIPYPAVGGITSLDAVEQASDSFFLVPATGATATSSISRAIDARPAPGSPRIGSVPLAHTACTLGIGVSGYNCRMVISGFTPAVDKYYLRLSLLYGVSSRVSVAPLNAGNPATFRNVQYVIDVTGRANDVYRRVQSRVSPESTALYPEYAVDTAGLICKDITVADAANTTYCP